LGKSNQQYYFHSAKLKLFYDHEDISLKTWYNINNIM